MPTNSVFCNASTERHWLKLMNYFKYLITKQINATYKRDCVLNDYQKNIYLKNWLTKEDLSNWQHRAGLYEKTPTRSRACYNACCTFCKKKGQSTARNAARNSASCSPAGIKLILRFTVDVICAICWTPRTMHFSFLQILHLLLSAEFVYNVTGIFI